MFKDSFHSTDNPLSELIPIMECNFSQENEDYKKLFDEEENILKEYDNLRKVWDDREVVPLTEEEIKELTKLRTLLDKRLSMLSEYMFIQGVKFYADFLK